jgi:hypothetical protein
MPPETMTATDKAIGAALAGELCVCMDRVLSTQPSSPERQRAIEEWQLALDRTVTGDLDRSLAVRRAAVTALAKKAVPFTGSDIPQLRQRPRGRSLSGRGVTVYDPNDDLTPAPKEPAFADFDEEYVEPEVICPRSDEEEEREDDEVRTMDLAPVGLPLRQRSRAMPLQQ